MSLAELNKRVGEWTLLFLWCTILLMQHCLGHLYGGLGWLIRWSRSSRVETDAFSMEILPYACCDVVLLCGLE